MTGFVVELHSTLPGSDDRAGEVGCVSAYILAEQGFELHNVAGDRLKVPLQHEKSIGLSDWEVDPIHAHTPRPGFDEEDRPSVKKTCSGQVEESQLRQLSSLIRIFHSPLGAVFFKRSDFEF